MEANPGVGTLKSPQERVPIRREGRDVLVPGRDRAPIRDSPSLLRARARASSSDDSLRRSRTRTTCCTKRDARAIEVSSSMTHTGMPCRPRLRAIPSP